MSDFYQVQRDAVESLIEWATAGGLNGDEFALAILEHLVDGDGETWKELQECGWIVHGITHNVWEDGGDIEETCRIALETFKSNWMEG